MTHRLFVAVDVSAPAIDRVAEQVERVRSLAAGARWAGGDAGHLTLAFLGAVAGDLMPPIAAALSAVATRHRPFAIALKGSGLFGRPRRARVLWVGVAGDLEALCDLQADVADALRKIVLALEPRPFHPHLTLARARSPLGDPGLAAAAAALADVGFGEQPVGEIVLYESHLGPAGARHEARQRCPLGG